MSGGDASYSFSLTTCGFPAIWSSWTCVGAQSSPPALSLGRFSRTGKLFQIEDALSAISGVRLLPISAPGVIARPTLTACPLLSPQGKLALGIKATNGVVLYASAPLLRS